MQRLPAQMMCWILPGTSMDLNLAGRSGTRCGMCRSPSASTSTILPRYRVLPLPTLFTLDLLLSCTLVPPPQEPRSTSPPQVTRSALYLVEMHTMDSSQNCQARHPSPRTRSIPLTAYVRARQKGEKKGFARFAVQSGPVLGS
jgi:hypothetical protein